MFLSLQRTRLIAAAFFTTIIFYFLFSSLHDEFEDYVKVPFISNLLPATPGSPSTLIKNAHTLQSADAFLPHFRAVTSLPGITLAEAKAGCTWKEDQQVNFMYSGDASWVIHERNESELASRRAEWQSYITNDLMPYKRYSSSFSGRGIAVVAGNERTMKRVKVLLHALKYVNSTLPVEVHFFGDEVPLSTQEDMLSQFPSPEFPALYFNDLSSPSNIIQTGFNHYVANFQFKPVALMNSRFSEVLLLDSDNIPAIDPEELFESTTYKEYGTLFWPDIARTRPQNPIWPITNTICSMDEYEQESGQLLVDKRRYFYHLQMAAWLNNNNAAYYNEFLLGDKDMFRFTWHALKTAYGKPGKWLTSVGTLTNESYCGHSFAQHHPDGRIAFVHGGLLKQIPDEVMRWQREERGGVFQVYKRSEVDEDHAKVEKCGMRWDGGAYLPQERRNKDKELKVWMCIDMYDVEARPLWEVLPGFEEEFEKVGGYWVLDK